jgi:hypothetical protein
VTAWIVAESLERLRAQLNAFAPNRSKTADGGIGDAAHASRDSDHNPWVVLAGQPLVTARDFTHDPAGGLNCDRLAAALQKARDSRVKYVIWDHRIMAGAGGPAAWTWRPYTGISPHTEHLHLSVVADKRCRDGSPWMLPGMTSNITPPETSKWPTIRRGSVGPAVETIQRFLGVQPVSGVFGPLTETAVRKYQQMRGLTADGICGPATWQATGLKETP